MDNRQYWWLYQFDTVLENVLFIFHWPLSILSNMVRNFTTWKTDHIYNNNDKPFNSTFRIWDFGTTKFFNLFWAFFIQQPKQDMYLCLLFIIFYRLVRYFCYNSLFNKFFDRKSIHAVIAHCHKFCKFYWIFTFLILAKVCLFPNFTISTYISN